MHVCIDGCADLDSCLLRFGQLHCLVRLVAPRPLKFISVLTASVALFVAILTNWLRLITLQDKHQLTEQGWCLSHVKRPNAARRGGGGGGLVVGLHF